MYSPLFTQIPHTQNMTLLVLIVDIIPFLNPLPSFLTTTYLALNWFSLLLNACLAKILNQVTDFIFKHCWLV